MVKGPTMQKYCQNMFKNIFWQLLILSKACKMTQICMLHTIGSTVPVLDKYQIQQLKISFSGKIHQNQNLKTFPLLSRKIQLSVRCYVNLTLVKKMLQVKYVPNTIDIDIKSRLNTLKENLISINSNSNNNNNNNNNFLPPRPPSSPLPSLHKQDNFFSIFFSTTSNNSLTKLFWTSTKNTTTHAISTATTA